MFALAHTSCLSLTQYSDDPNCSDFISIRKGKIAPDIASVQATGLVGAGECSALARD